MGSRNTRRKYCGKNLTAKIGKISNDCFEISLVEVAARYPTIGSDIELFKHDMKMFSRFGYAIYNPEGFALLTAAKEELDSLYLQKLSALPTQIIEDILWVHHNNKIRRAQRTVETLTSELTRRAMLDDSLESDSNTECKGVSKPKRRSKK
jgi:hypothetical protein